MKIKKSNAKRAGVSPPELAPVFERFLKEDGISLANSIRELVPPNKAWPYPRADLHHWIQVLDKFDGILGHYIKEYGLARTQVVPFKPEDKDLILEILRLEKLVMENSTSRKIFASYDHLFDMMNTSDLDILEAVLALVHRPSQQYSTGTSFEVNESAAMQGKLLLLATAGGAWGKLKENGWGLVKLSQLVASKQQPNEPTTLVLPESFYQLNAQFYRPSTQAQTSHVVGQLPPGTPDTKELVQPTSELRLGSQDPTRTSSPAQVAEEDSRANETPTKRPAKTPLKGRVASLAGADPVTPQKQAAAPASGTVSATSFSRSWTNHDGLTQLSLPAPMFAPIAKSRSKTPNQVLAELIDAHSELQGDDMKDVDFEILSRLRCVMAVGTPDGQLTPEIRAELAKMISIRLTAMAIYIHVVSEDVAQTDLFLHEPTIIGQLGELIQPTTGIEDSVVTAALMVMDACQRYRSKASEVFSALSASVAHGVLMSFLRDLIKRLGTDEDVPYPLVDATLAFLAYAVTASGHMLIGAGLVTALIDLVKITDPKRGGFVARAIGLLDTVIYANPNAFDIFCNAGGLDVLNGRIIVELDRYLGPEGIQESEDLSAILKKTTPLRLMLRSIHRLMQSGGTTESLRNLIDSQLPKSILRILQNPNKLGPTVLAISINIAATFVHNEPTSLPIIQEMKIPEALYDALEENKHPSFEVISAIPYALGALCLNQVGMDYALSRPKLIKLLVNSAKNPDYRQVLRERDNAAYLGSSLDELARHHPPLKAILLEAIFDMLRDVAAMGQMGRFGGVSKIADYKLILDEAQTTAEKPASSGPETELPAPLESAETRMDTVILLTSQLLSGMFQNPHLAKDFLSQGGLQYVINLYDLPCLVSQFAMTESASHMNEVFRNLAEADLPKVLSGIVGAVTDAMGQVPSMWRTEPGSDEEILEKSLHPKDERDLEEANTRFRRAIYLNNLVGLICSLYSTIGFAHGKVGTAFLQALGAADDSHFIANLGRLHRSAVWVNVWLKNKSFALNPSKDKSTSTQRPPSPTTEAMTAAVPNTASSSESTAPVATSPTNPENTAPPSKTQTPMPENLSSLKYLYTRLPLHLGTFFQGVVKMLLFRRAEPSHKVQSVPTANQIADMLVQHLVPCDKPQSDGSLNWPYIVSMVNLVSHLLFEPRLSQITVHTMLLIAFQKKGGVAKMNQLMHQYIGILDKEKAEMKANPSYDRNHIVKLLTGFKYLCDFVKILTSGRPLVESPQTLILITKDKEPDHEDYFSPTEFIVKMRLDCGESLWAAFNAEWLTDGPLSLVQTVSKATISLLEPVPDFMNSSTANATTDIKSLSSSLSSLGFPTSRSDVSSGPTVPDPTYVNLLVEMGFNTYAARESLSRTNNVFPSAAYFAVQNGHLLRDPLGTEDSKSDVDMSYSGTPASVSPRVSAKAIAEGRKCHLEARKKRFLKELPSRAIQLVEIHNSLVFDFAPMILESEHAFNTLVDGLKNPGDPGEERDKRLQGRLRLFAVVAHQPAFGSKYDSQRCLPIMDAIQALDSPAVAPRPSWVSAKLLALDCLFGWGESVKSDPSGDTLPDTVLTGPFYPEVRARTLTYAAELLKQPDLNEDELLAVLRTLVFLTRDRSLLQPFLEQSGLTYLFQAVLATPAKKRHASLALATTICRHLVEDGQVLQRCMQREIQQWFSKPRTTTINIKHFVSNLRSAALRDSDIFLKVAENECKLLSGEPRHGIYHIATKEKEQDSAQPTAAESSQDDTAMQVEDPFHFASTGAQSPTKPLEQVMNYLINEILTVSKNQTKNSDVSAGEEVKPQPSLESQLSAVLLVLVELLGSYNESKLMMFQANKKTGKDVSAAIRPRSLVLSTLLNQYVCNIIFDADVNRATGDKVTDSQKERMNISNWAGAVIVALCSDPNGTSNLKDPTTPIVSIRKAVMDTIAKAIKDVSHATDPLNLRYGRLWALSELCFRLLTARSTVQPKHHDDSALHVAKIMLEKGFVPILTNAMADVDLTYPQVKNLITAMVQPLEYLTKISMKMARPERSKTVNPEDSEDESMSSGSESEDEEMDEDEASNEAAEMYRNSSLGMFGGEMEEYGDDSEDMDDDDEEDDLDHYEEVVDDESSRGTETTEDSEEGEEELEHWEDQMDEDEVQVEGEEVFPEDDLQADSQSEEEDFELFDDGAVEIMEHDHDHEVDGYAGDEGDFLDEGEEGSESDYDETELDELDTVVVDPLSSNSASGPTLNWGWGQPVRLQSREDTHNHNRAYRHHSHAMSLFHDPASYPGAPLQRPPVESIVNHPLLSQDPSAGAPAPSLQGRAQAARSLPGPLGDVLHSIEQLMGENTETAQMLEHLMESAPGHPRDMLRVEYGGPAGGAHSFNIPLGGRRLGGSRLGRENGAASDAEAAFSSIPLPTLSRWQEEEGMVNPFDSATRITNIGNWLVHALLPAAKEADEKRRKELEEAQQKEAKEEQARQEKEKQERLQKEAEEAEQRRKEEAEKPAVPDTADADVQMTDADQAPSTGADTTNSGSAERVTVMMHGAEVDITDTGIDPEFLEALPEDMREEVLAQHLRESRPVEAQSQPAVSTEISPEFLNALPPEIRAEVIQQEAMEAARRSAESRAVAQPTSSITASSRPVNLLTPGDFSAFFSSLDPGLRQLIMSDRNAGSHPRISEQSDRLFEGTSLTDGERMDHIRRAMTTRLLSGALDPRSQPQVPKPKPPPREAIQLLDKPGIAALIRLLFFPDINKKDRLLKVLANLCENNKSRSDVVGLLLSILQDDTGDLSSVDKQSAVKSSKNLSATPKVTPKKRPVPDSPANPAAAMLSGLHSDSIPAFVAQRAFEALGHIANANEHTMVFFLTEQDVPVAAAKSSSKKGKGKEKNATHMYPINALLKLLDRESLFRTPGMAETLTALLATLTKPLSQLTKSKDTAKKDEGPQSEPGSTSVGPAPTQDPSEGQELVVGQSADVSSTQPSNAVSSENNVAGTASNVKEPANALLQSPPSISEDILKLVPNVLTHGDCSSKTFSSTLGLIQNLTNIPTARDVISAQLQDQAQKLGDVLRTELQELYNNLVESERSGFEKEVSAGNFSVPSSAQTKLLRVLKTIDYIYSSKTPNGSSAWDASTITSVAEGTKQLNEQEATVEMIFDSMHFEALWDILGNCLTIVERKDSLMNIATVLLPLVESFMVVSKYGSAKAAASRGRGDSVPFSPMSPREASEVDQFVTFTSRHRKVLNTMVRNNPTLMSGSFSLLILNPRVLEFDNKRNWFMQQLRKKPNREAGGHLHLNIRREYIFEDSYRALQSKSGDALKYGKLNIKFYEEEGVDAGGVTREWYSVLAQSIFNPGYCLFEPCAADEGTYQPSQHSWVNGEHLGYFRFIGKLIGKAIYDQRLLDAYFSRAFYKQILGRKVDVRDLESVDPDYHKSLIWMLENDITGVIELDFSLETEEFGAKKVIDLKEGGSKIPVTEENKEEYVRLVVEHRLETSIQNQVKAFLAGFYEIIPPKLISVFDPDQLELLISGVSNIDVDELKNATQLHGWKNSDAEIAWFWRALRSFSQEEKAKFLMFVTSSSRVPLGGFTQLQGSNGIQPFQIHKLYRENVLPSSATCFNELLLPSFPSYEDLRAKLLTAVSEGAGHFGLG